MSVGGIIKTFAGVLGCCCNACEDPGTDLQVLFSGVIDCGCNSPYEVIIKDLSGPYTVTWTGSSWQVSGVGDADIKQYDEPPFDCSVLLSTTPTKFTISVFCVDRIYDVTAEIDPLGTGCPYVNVFSNFAGNPLGSPMPNQNACSGTFAGEDGVATVSV